VRERGERLGGRYRLEHRIGAGGMGEVWRAVDELLGRVVAVKVMLPRLMSEYGFAQRFLAEAQAMASVNHPGVVGIHDYHSEGDTAFLVMDYVQGESLSQLLARYGRLSPEYTMNLVGQAADALRAVHERGIVHRDVKPANLLIRPGGAAVLTDFGIARAPTGTGLTLTGAVIGTPTYLAPEQVLGQPATPPSDLYSLGLVAYECLAGHRPFDADSPVAMALRRIREAPPTLAGHVPPAVRAVVDRALVADPAGRWRSAAELAGAARAAAAGFVPPPPPPPPRYATPPRSKRRVWVLAAVLFGLMVLGAGAWLALTIDPGGGGDPEGGRNRGSSAAPVDSTLAGYLPCGEVHCPPEPMCWGGLTVIGGVAQDVRQVDCERSHFWETYAVIAMPDGAADRYQDELMRENAIAAACSERVLAQRSQDPAATEGWDREAWPFETDDGGWVVHCLASSTEGETTGSAFRAG
jgi:eukaryotic-like serine/threonine-protein kinase